MNTAVEIGSTLGAYRIERRLGPSPAGTAYRASGAAGEIVTVEFLAPELAGTSGFRDRLERDAARAVSLEHPHIAAVHAIGEADGMLYVVTEAVDGVDLATLVERLGTLSFLRAAGLVAQIASAVDAAHAAGLTHGAIEPGRILVADDEGADYALLSGFGLARASPQRGGEDGRWQGPPSAGYAAPEQIQGAAAGPATDVYSLGCTLHTAVTGEPPLRRPTEAGTLEAHLRETVAPPSHAVVELPPAFDGVLARALEKDPDRRYSSVAELASAALQAGGLVPPPATAQMERERVLAAWQRSLAAGARSWSPSAVARSASPPTEVGSPPASRGSPPASSDSPPAESAPAVASSGPAPGQTANGGGREPAGAAVAGAHAPGGRAAKPPAAPAPAAGGSRRPVIVAPSQAPPRSLRAWVGARPRALAATLAVIAVVVTGILLLTSGNDGASERSAQGLERSRAGEAAPGPAERRSSGQLIEWPDRSAYTVVVYAADTGRAQARSVARRAARLGYEAGVLRSSDHASLEAGKVVGFAGVFRSRRQALRAADRLRAARVTVSPYVRFVSAPS